MTELQTTEEQSSPEEMQIANYLTGPMSRFKGWKFLAGEVKFIANEVGNAHADVLQAAAKSIVMGFKEKPALKLIIDAVHEAKTKTNIPAERSSNGAFTTTEDNSIICNCGRHRGVGDFRPEERAGVYAWYYANDLFFALTSDKLAWLDDYQQYHGQVRHCMIGNKRVDFKKLLPCIIVENSPQEPRQIAY
jgi:hypothetical protein